MLSKPSQLPADADESLIQLYDYVVALRREIDDALYNLDSENISVLNATTIRTAKSGTRLELTYNVMTSFNDLNQKEGFCIEAYGLYDIFCALMYRSGSVIGGMTVDDGLTLYSAWYELSSQPLHILSGGNMFIDTIDPAGVIKVGTRDITVDFSDSNAIGLKNYSLTTHDHLNKYVKTGSSQNLKIQAFEGETTNYIEIWLDGVFLGQVDLT